MNLKLDKAFVKFHAVSRISVLAIRLSEDLSIYIQEMV